MRLNYPANIKIIQVPCTGRVDMLHLLKAIEEGADGVYVAGCLEGECHFLEGNLKTRKKVVAVQKLLAEAGLRPERVRMFNLSSAMGPRFAEIAEEMTETIRRLGPSPIKSTGRIETGKQEMGGSEPFYSRQDTECTPNC